MGMYIDDKIDSALFYGLPMPSIVCRLWFNELPRSKLRGIGGMGTIIMPPHALSRKGRNIVTPKQSFEESID
jgi:hypothetical protein